MSEYIETDDASYFRVRRQAYVSAELHRRELHEIFDDSWLYAAHLSELREPGDFITRDYAGRFFCPQCGSSVFSRSTDEIEVSLGALDAPDQFQPTYELWTIRREGWLPAFPLARHYERDREGDGRSEE